MSEQNEMAIEQVKDENWKTKALVIGAALGAAVGGLAAYTYVQSVEEGEKPEVGPGEGIKLGVLIFGLLRSISGIFDK